MQIDELDILGCYLVTLPHFKDERGEFVKTFNRDLLRGTVLEQFSLEEEFYSVSQENVLRGLHFQNKPAEHDKLIYCISGEVLDFFLDIRKKSPTYGKHLSIELSSRRPKLLFLPKGIAHGFLTVSKFATLVYKTNYPYTPSSDTGILWSSVGLDLPIREYIVSERDSNFVTLSDFNSEF